MNETSYHPKIPFNKVYELKIKKRELLVIRNT